MTTTTDESRVKNALDAIDFPADKDDLVAEAERAGADTDTVKALRSIQQVSYENMREVLAAVPLTVAGTEDQSESDKAQQHRTPVKDGVATHMRETPDNPIVDELGENRGS